MSGDDKIEIPLSKTKILLLLFGSIVLVAVCIFIIMEMESSFLIEIVGYCGILFFGFAFTVLIRKLFDRRPGLIIDQHGITDHSNYTSVGRIDWDDILGIGTYQVQSTKMIVIEIDQPEKYISRAKNSLVEKSMRMNHKMSGSPLTIISGSLKISHDELERLLWSELMKREGEV